MSTLRSSADILAANDYWKEKDWDAAKAILDGFTPSGTFKSAYSFIIAVNNDGGTNYFSASNAYQTIYGGSTADNHHIGSVDGASARAVIQAAVTACASGGSILITKGSYLLDGHIDIAGVNYLLIQGAGIGNTIITTFGFDKNDNIATYGCTFRDFTIDLKSTEDQNCMNLFGTGGCINFTFQRVEMKDSGNEFLFNWSYADNLLVENCIFEDGGLTLAKDNCAGGSLPSSELGAIWRSNLFIKEHSLGSAMLTTGETGNVIVDGNIFVDLSDLCYAAVSIENFYGNCKNIIVSNNKIYGTLIQMGNSDDNPILSATITGNIIEGLPNAIGGGGIAGNSVDKLIIADNTLIDCMEGIVTLNCGVVNINNNIIKNVDSCLSGLVTQAGICCSANNVTTINGNTIYDDAGTTSYGIYAGFGGAGDYYITNNQLKGAFLEWAIDLAACNHVSILGNDIVAGVTGAIANMDLPTTIKVRYNTGFITEVSGKANGASPITVNHGLSCLAGYYPTLINCTVRSNDGNKTAAVYDETATTFKIYHNTGGVADVYYYAEYIV